MTYIIERSVIPLVSGMTCKSCKFLAILVIFRSTKLEGRVVCLGDLIELLWILLSNLSKELNEATDNDVLDLFEESAGLQGLTRYI
jgi:hypothetical protein